MSNELNLKICNTLVALRKERNIKLIRFKTFGYLSYPGARDIEFVTTGRRKPTEGPVKLSTIIKYLASINADMYDFIAKLEGFEPTEFSKPEDRIAASATKLDTVNFSMALTLKQLRIDKGMDRPFVEDKLGFDSGRLSTIELGRQGFTLDLILKLLDVYNVTLTTFTNKVNNRLKSGLSRTNRVYDLNAN